MSKHYFYSTLNWLWNNRHESIKPGWGGHNLETAPGPWTNFSLSTLLLDMWDHGLRFEDLEKLLTYIEEIIFYSLHQFKSKNAKGFPPRYEMEWTKDYSTITSFSFLDCATKFQELKNKYCGSYQNDDLNSAITVIADNMNKKFSDGYSFMPEYGSSSISLVSTFVSGYIIRRIVDRIAFVDISKESKKSFNEINIKYNSNFVKFITETVDRKRKQSDYFLLPLKLNSSATSIAASSWFLIYLLNSGNQIKDFKDEIEKITLAINNSDIEIESELGENNDYYPWFVPAIALHAITTSPYTRFVDNIRIFNNLLENFYYFDSDNSYFYFYGHRTKYNTWPTRDSLMALSALFENIQLFEKHLHIDNAISENIYYENRIFVGGSFEDTARYDVFSQVVEEEGFECVSALKIPPLDLNKIAKWDLHLTDLCYIGIFDMTHHEGGGSLIELSRMIKNEKPILIFVERKKYKTPMEAIKDKVSSMISTDPRLQKSIIVYSSWDELRGKLRQILQDIRKKKPSNLGQDVIIEILLKIT